MKTDYVIHRPVSNLYLVRERDRRRLLELLILAAAVFAVGAGLLTYTWMHLELTRLGYQTEELTRQLGELREEERRLEKEEAWVTSPSRVEEKAKAMGMIHPNLDQVVFVEELP